MERFAENKSRMYQSSLSEENRLAVNPATNLEIELGQPQADGKLTATSVENSGSDIESVVRISRVEQLKRREEFDLQVKDLRDQQLSHKQIAELLGVTVGKVAHSSHRLIGQGEVDKRYKRNKRSEDDYSQVDSEIKRLREQGVSVKEIRQQLELSESNYSNRVSQLLKAEEIQPLHRGHKKGRTRFALEQILVRYQAQNPGQPVTLTNLAREVGVTRQRVFQLYPQIAKSREVPPLYAKQFTGPRDEFDQQVKRLDAQGLDTTEISNELKVIKTLVKQAKLRNNRENNRNERNAKEESIRILRNQGLGGKRISEITGIPQGSVFGILQRLFTKESSLRIRKIPMSKEEQIQFREKVAELRLDPRNLNDDQIAQITGESKFTVNHAIYKLIKDGRIPSRTGKGSKTSKLTDTSY